SGKTASGTTNGAGGTAGNGGSQGNTGGGGGGFLTDANSAQGGKSFLNGGTGGNGATGLGGFGGGGGITGQNNMRAGGGGGYSGGGGCGSSTSVPQIGGGGGSFNSGANQVNTPGLGTGHGMVVVTLLAPAISVPNNAGITSFPSLASGICPGSQVVSVKVRNFGSNFVDSVKIAWTVNGVLQSNNFYKVGLDTFPVLNYDSTITLGTYNFVSGSYLIKAWVSLPNNQPDTVNNNDTLTISVTPRLTGTFTLNSAGGANYQTFSAFASDLATFGVCGPVVLNVAPGSGPYNEQVTMPQVNGTSVTNTITINGSGTTLTNAGTASNYATLSLNGTDYLTVNNLNIVSTGATNGFGVHLSNGADNNTFDSCVITASTTATGTTTGCVIMSGSPILYSTGGANGSNNTFSYCDLTGGYFGFSFYGTSTAGNMNNNILNCHAKDYYIYGVYLLQQGSGTIANSIFERPTRTGLSTFYGVFMTTGCTNMLVEKNIVRNPAGGAPSTSFTGYSLYCAATASLGNENKFFNNIVGNLNGIGIRGGLYLTGATYVQAYHNTIVIDHTAMSSSALYGIYATGTAGVDIRNNNVVVTQPSSGIKYGMYFTGAGKTSNNNNIYVNGGGTGANNVGYFSAAFATLANWKTANSNAFDQNSVDVDPLFVNAGAGNFTPTNALMNDLGAPIGIATDINGVTRSVIAPDMGAVEFSVAACGGTPTPGTATVTGNLTSACNGTPITLNLSGFSIGQGISIQWEESPAGAGVWTAINGATSSSPGVTFSGSATDYRAVVTCANGGGFDVSNTISISTNPFYLCYCSPLTGVTLHGTTANYVTNVSIPNTTLNSTTSAVGAGGYTQQNYLTASNTASLVQGQTYTLNLSVTSASYPT
ncbi:MAG TPA: hypothetical protein PLU07_10850, partial [Ferruginibacter sp.]|nr:hypothetical protein [Ferruginibacter sp.]